MHGDAGPISLLFLTTARMMVSSPETSDCQDDQGLMSPDTVSWGQQHPLPAQLPHAPCQQWQRLMMKSSSAGLTSIIELEHTYWYFCFRMKVTRLETQETKNRFIRCSNEISQLSVIMNARCLMSINTIYLTVCLSVILFSKEKSGEVRRSVVQNAELDIKYVIRLLHYSTGHYECLICKHCFKSVTHLCQKPV